MPPLRSRFKYRKTLLFLLRNTCALALIWACLPGRIASADETSEDLANTPVRKRNHPDFQPSGIFVGGIGFFPAITVARQFNSNLFASPDLQVDDLALIVSPALNIRKDGEASTYRLELDASHYEYDRFDSENRTEANALLETEWEIASGFKLDTILQGSRKYEARGDSLTASQSAIPIAYNDLRAETTITKSINRLGLALTGSVRNLSYDDGETSSGTRIDQSFRDGTITTGNLMPFYDFSPGYRAYTRFQVNQRDYEGVGSLNRDSEGFEAGGGVEFMITPLLLGSIDGGYFEQRYENPQIPPASGPSINANLVWLMTPLMTVTLMTSRAVAELAAPDQDARIDFSAGIQLDYEIRRNLIATLAAHYKNEEFTASSRQDDIVRLESKIDYAMNHYFSFGINYAYLERQSNFADFDFDQHRVTVNVTAQY